MNLRPLRDGVVLKRLESAPNPAGLVLPENAKQTNSTMESRTRAVVLAIGPGEKRPNGSLKPMPVKVGDVVRMGPQPWKEFEHDGEKIIFAYSDDITAIEDPNG